MVVFITFTPDTLAASGLEPTANIFLPKVVLFQMNHIRATMIAAYNTYHGTVTLEVPSPKVKKLPVTKFLKESSRPDSGCPLLPLIMMYISKEPYTISCVARVTINGCSWNLATKKPLTHPTIPPTRTTARITTGIGRTGRFGNIFVE